MFLWGGRRGRWAFLDGVLVVVFFGVFELEESGLGLEEERALMVFPDAEEYKGEGCRGGPKFRIARDFGFRFPAEELGGDEESQNGPAGERNRFDPNCGDARAVKGGALKSPDQIRGGKEERKFLRNGWKVGKRHRRARKKNQREPDELIENLRLLHGVGDAGNDQAHRCEGNDADGDE